MQCRFGAHEAQWVVTYHEAHRPGDPPQQLEVCQDHRAEMERTPGILVVGWLPAGPSGPLDRRTRPRRWVIEPLEVAEVLEEVRQSASR